MRAPDEREHLQFLGMMHYLAGGLAMMLALVPALHLYVGALLASSGAPVDSWITRTLGYGLGAWVAGAVLVFGFALGVWLAVAGFHLGRCHRYRFCLAAAWAGCLFVPFGTGLAAITIPLLKRPSVRALFTDSPPLHPPA